MRRLNPFASLPNPREVFAWGMYDLANQSFTLLIITVLFPIYFREVVVADPQRGDALWSIAVSAALLIVVVCSPVAGAMADSRGWRKSLLMATGVVSGTLTIALAGLGWMSGAGWPAGWVIASAMGLFIAANVAYQIGENLLASFLPSVSTPRTIGRVSAIGWTMGYVGALLLLAITLGSMALRGWQDPEQWAAYFVLAGVWFLGGMIVPWVVLTEPARRPLPSDAGTLVGAAAARLGGTLRGAAQYRQLFRFLLAFLVYGFGVQTMIAFASILASDFGIRGSMLIVFVAQLTVTAGITAALTSRFQDRLGAKATIALYLLVWIASTGALFAVEAFGPASPAQWIFWTVGNGIGIGLGGIGTASRSMVGRFAPAGRTAEFFGLWGMTYKLAGAIGVLAFGQVKAWIGDAAALAALAGFFVVGLALLMRVDEMAGVRAARRAERNGAREDAARDARAL